MLKVTTKLVKREGQKVVVTATHDGQEFTGTWTSTFTDMVYHRSAVIALLEDKMGIKIDLPSMTSEKQDDGTYIHSASLRTPPAIDSYDYE